MGDFANRPQIVHNIILNKDPGESSSAQSRGSVSVMTALNFRSAFIKLIEF